MKQFILLNTYCGLSDFTFEVNCSGRHLSLKETLEKGLVTIEQLHRHKASSYIHGWYEITTGVTFVVKHYNEDKDPVVNTICRLRVPAEGMPNPNTDLDNIDATGYWLEQHLREQCELIDEQPYHL